MFSGFHKIPPQNSYFSNKYEFYFTLFFHSVNSKLTFLERKVSQRTFAPNTSLYFGKVFEVPRDFLQKVLWSGFGAEAPTDNEHKNAAMPRFLNCHYMLEHPFQTSFSYLSYKKGKPKNFPQTHHFISAKISASRTSASPSLIPAVTKRRLLSYYENSTKPHI